MLASVCGAESVLELGTFTGYSALCFAEGLAKGKSKRGVDAQYMKNDSNDDKNTTPSKNTNSKEFEYNKGAMKIDESLKSMRRVSVVTCEIDSTAADIASEHFNKSEYKDEVN